MNCIICNSQTKYYFSTDFSTHFNGRFKEQLDKSHFYKCTNCGFTFSKSIYEMSNEEWKELNLKAHTAFESEDLNTRITNQPPYLEQASMINLLIKHNILNGGGNPLTPNTQSLKNIDSTSKAYNILDYAGGIGSLARILSFYYHIDILVYEEYMSEFLNDGVVTYIKRENLAKYDCVLNSACFEHITKREHLEHINSLIKDDGALIVHTLVRENIPKNPNWFYIMPIHCSFHTNNSMQILMEQWDYSECIYSPISKCWILFKKNNINCINNTLEQFCNDINKALQKHYFFYKKGFVDYWLD